MSLLISSLCRTFYVALTFLRYNNDFFMLKIFITTDHGIADLMLGGLWSWYSSTWYFEHITSVSPRITTVHCDSSECHQATPTPSVIGQCITWPSLLFPARQEVNVTIFIIFHRILPGFNRNLMNIGMVSKREVWIVQHLALTLSTLAITSMSQWPGMKPTLHCTVF